MASTLDNSLSLKQEQKQILSPAQIQSLELLALPIQDMAAYINEQLLENPMLEAAEENRDVPPEQGEEPLTPEEACLPPEERESWAEDGGPYYNDEYAGFIVVNNDTGDSNFVAAEPGYSLDDQSLRHHLLLQMSFLELPAAEKTAIRAIIYALDEDGYLRVDLPELAETLDIDPACMERVLNHVQSFDPPGVGARDLAECLRLQLPATHSDYGLIRGVIDHHLSDLAAGRSRNVARAFEVSERKVEEAFAFVRSLNPRPASATQSRERIHYIVPDIIVRKVDGDYRVSLNDHFHPQLRISSYYRQFSGKELESEEVREYVRQKIGAAMLLIRNIERRHQTIYRLAEIVVMHQREFLDHGLAYLKPLTMREVAERAELHESTVSRAVGGKYVETPRGVYPWKFFFTRAYTGEDGNIVAGPYVKKLIAELIAAEDPAHPLSDRQIEERLAARGIMLARRTVAKYRGEMCVPKQSYRRRPRGANN